MSGGSTTSTANTNEHAENNVTNNQEWNYFGKDTKNDNTHDYTEVKGMDVGGKVVMLSDGYNAKVQVFSKAPSLSGLQLVLLVWRARVNWRSPLLLRQAHLPRQRVS